MRILVAPDKFKGSLGAREVARYLAAGIKSEWPDAVINAQPIADGGEGTAEIIAQAGRGEPVWCEIHDSLGRKIRASYFLLSGSQTAVMETSAAAGLSQLAPEELNPLAATTFGVGEMLLHAACREARSALGSLGQLREIRAPNEVVLPETVAAADVENPLLGERGTTGVFSVQKGATAAQQQFLEAVLNALASVSANTFRRDARSFPGVGGLGFGLITFCSAIVRPGFSVVAEALHLRQKIERADWIITGEGSLDRQSLEGKAPLGFARLAREFRRPITAIVGRSDDDPEVGANFDEVVRLKDTRSDFSATPRLREAAGRRLARERCAAVVAREKNLRAS